MHYILQFIDAKLIFLKKKKLVLNFTPRNDKRFLGKNECVTSCVILPAPLIFNF